MAAIEHIVTQEIIDEVKARLVAYCESRDIPEPTIFKKAFPGGKLQFICKWLTDEEYREITDRDDFRAFVKRDRDAAELHLHRKILEKCVLWPSTFDPLMAAKSGQYPAGIIDGLIEAIMTQSGFTQEAVPEQVLDAPEVTNYTLDEAIALVKDHPCYQKHGILLSRVFFVRNFDLTTGETIAIPVKNYLYGPIDRGIYAASQAAKTREEAQDIVLKAAIMWPKNIDWAQEPANYAQWLVAAVMEASAFGNGDPSVGVEIL